MVTHHAQRGHIQPKYARSSAPTADPIWSPYMGGLLFPCRDPEVPFRDYSMSNVSTPAISSPPFHLFLSGPCTNLPSKRYPVNRRWFSNRATASVLGYSPPRTPKRYWRGPGTSVSLLRCRTTTTNHPSPHPHPRHTPMQPSSAHLGTPRC